MEGKCGRKESEFFFSEKNSLAMFWEISQLNTAYFARFLFCFSREFCWRKPYRAPLAVRNISFFFLSILKGKYKGGGGDVAGMGVRGGGGGDGLEEREGKGESDWRGNIS